MKLANILLDKSKIYTPLFIKEIKSFCVKNNIQILNESSLAKIVIEEKFKKIDEALPSLWGKKKWGKETEKLGGKEWKEKQAAGKAEFEKELGQTAVKAKEPELGQIAVKAKEPEKKKDEELPTSAITPLPEPFGENGIYSLEDYKVNILPPNLDNFANSCKRNNFSGFILDKEGLENYNIYHKMPTSFPTEYIAKIKRNLVDIILISDKADRNSWIRIARSGISDNLDKNNYLYIRIKTNKLGFFMDALAKTAY